MFLNHIISWGMVAMLTSLTMTTGSVDRNSTLSQNNNPAPVEKVTKGKGCATDFVCPAGTLPFYYNHNIYSQLDVQDVTKWTSGYNPTRECDGEEVACLICVGSSFVEGEGTNMSINPNLTIETEDSALHQAKVTGSTNDPLFEYRNENL